MAASLASPSTGGAPLLSDVLSSGAAALPLQPATTASPGAPSPRAAAGEEASAPNAASNAPLPSPQPMAAAPEPAQAQPDMSRQTSTVPLLGAATSSAGAAAQPAADEAVATHPQGEVEMEPLDGADTGAPPGHAPAAARPTAAEGCLRSYVVAGACIADCCLCAVRWRARTGSHGGNGPTGAAAGTTGHGHGGVQMSTQEVLHLALLSLGVICERVARRGERKWHVGRMLTTRTYKDTRTTIDRVYVCMCAHTLGALVIVRRGRWRHRHQPTLYVRTRLHLRVRSWHGLSYVPDVISEIFGDNNSFDATDRDTVLGAASLVSSSACIPVPQTSRADM